VADLDNLVVTVGGDISDLQAAFDQIPEAAQTAAAAVQDAFAGQTDLFSDIGTQAQEAFAAVPEAAQAAAAEVADAFAGQADLFTGIDEQAQQAFDAIPVAAEEAAQATEAALGGVGDEVAQSFAQISQAAEEAGTTVNEAFGSTSGLSEIPDEANAATQAIGGIADEANTAAQGLDDVAESMSGMGASAGEVASNIEQIPPALHEVETESSSVSEGFTEMLATGLELAGIAITLEALKEALMGSIEAFAEFQRAGEALAAITQDAEGAAAALEAIPALADSLAQAIPSLEAAQQKFALFGVTLGQMPALLTAVSDAARASGNDFDSVASSFERMDATGKVMTRSLVAAGLSMTDLGNAMGMTNASVKDIQNAFANYGTDAEAAAERANVLVAATQKIAGISQATAGDVTGSWQQMSNAVHEAAVNIGDSLALIGGPGGVGVFKLALQGIETFVVALIGYVQQAVDIIVGLGKVALDVFMSVGRAAVAAANQDWTGAWSAITNGWNAVASDVHDTGQKMAADWTANGKIIDQIWATTATNVKTSTDGMTQSAFAMGKELLNEGYAATQLGAMLTAMGYSASQVGDALKLLGVKADQSGQQIQVALAKLGQSVASLLNSIPATEDAYLIQLQQGGEKATQMLSQINQALALAMKDMANLSLTPAQIAGIQQYIDQLNALKMTVQGFIEDDNLTKLGDKIQALADKFPVQVAEMDPAIQEWIKDMTAFAAAQHQAAQTDDPAAILANLLAMQKGFDDLADSMQKDWATFDTTFGKSLTSQLADAGVFTTQMEANIQAINKSWIDSSTTVTTWGAKVGAVYAMLKVLKIDDVSLDEQQLAAMQRNLQTMEQMGAPLQQQLAVQAQIAQLQIKIADSTGATAQQTLQWTEQLTAVQTQMNVLKDQTIGLSNLYTGMVKALGTAWTDLGKGLGDAMVSGQNFGAALTKVFDTLKQQIAELVTQYLLNQLKDAFLQNTDAVNSFAKVFNSIFGGSSGGGIIAPAMQSAGQAAQDFSQVSITYFGQAGDAVKSFSNTASSSMSSAANSVSQSASQMVSGLTAVASVVSAIASIFSAIELMHTNTLLSDIEHETARMAIYLGDSGSGSIQFYTGKSAEFLNYIHSDIVSMRGTLEAANQTLTDILAAVVVGGGGSGSGSGSGGSALQQLITQLGLDMKELSNQINGPYGLGPAVQGAATATGTATTATTGFTASVTAATTATTAAATAATTSTSALQASIQLIQTQIATLQGNLPTDTAAQYMQAQVQITALNGQLTTLNSQLVAAGGAVGTVATAATNTAAVMVASALSVTDANNAQFTAEAAAATAAAAALNTVSTTATNAATGINQMNGMVSTTIGTLSTTFASMLKAANAANPSTATAALGISATGPLTITLPNTTVATIGAGGAGGTGGSNSFTSNNILTNPGQLILNIQTNITPGVVAMNNNAQIQQFSDLVSKNVVTKLQQVGGQKIR
jgi:hypothetical protein